MATDDRGRREPKDVVADLVAERARSFGVDVGAAAGLADVLAAEIDGWFKQAAGRRPGPPTTPGAGTSATASPAPTASAPGRTPPRGR